MDMDINYFYACFLKFPFLFFPEIIKLKTLYLLPLSFDLELMQGKLTLE
jgi:hypothetical protein